MFVIDYVKWMEDREQVAKEYAEALPCLIGICKREDVKCRNCRLAKQAIEAICGPPPHRGDYRE